MHTLTIVGLGPGAPEQLTLEAHLLLQQAPLLFLRTRIHPTVAALPATLALESFDQLYEQAPDFASIYATIAHTLVERAATGAAVIYAVPGHPLIAEATTRHILATARTRAVQVRIVAGLSFLEPVATALGLDPLDQGLQLYDALELIPPPAPAAEGADRAWSELHAVGPYLSPAPVLLNATRPVLLCQLYSRHIAAEVKLSLLECYPAEHPVTIVRHAGLPTEALRTLPLSELDHAADLDHLTSLFLPALAPTADLRTFDTLRWIMERLAGPFGCPWDRKQTHASLRQYLLEETYEALEALDAEDWQGLAEELGDVLLQVVFHAELARQAGTFDIGDVTQAITTKMIRRHPHIFADTTAADADEVLRNWEAIKATERAEQGKQDRPSLLDGVPSATPALAAAQSIGQKAARVGFDWPEISGVWAKLHEEIAELEAAPPAEQAGELGDILFAVVNLARWMNLDAEAALRSTLQKFKRRFKFIEDGAQAQGRTLTSLSLAESEALWQAAKQFD